ncbi:MAG: ROK family protein, partial [Dehalococcoidales bacterium]
MPRTETQHRPVLAVDLGGTKMIIAVISADGRILARERCLTLSEEGPQPVITRLFAAIDVILGRQEMSPSQLYGICIGAAGIIDIKRGRLVSGPHLPGWSDLPLRDTVEEKYGIPSFLLNDASAAALGEHRYGAGQGTKDLVLLTVGTGIGGGIIVNGRLYQGAAGAAGEIGHMTIDVNGTRDICGNTGCLETLVSGTAIAAEVRRRLENGEKSSLREMANGRLGDITAEMVNAAARSRDALALEAISRMGTCLGAGLVSMVNIFNPEMIIIGGGVAAMGDMLLEPARRVVAERAFSLPARLVSLVPARL